MFFQRYLEYRDFIRIIRYEDVIAMPERVSELVGSSSVSSHLGMLNPTHRVYPIELVESIKQLLHQHATCCKAVYPNP